MPQPKLVPEIPLKTVNTHFLTFWQALNQVNSCPEAHTDLDRAAIMYNYFCDVQGQMGFFIYGT